MCPLVFLSFTPFFGLNMAGRNTQTRELLLNVTGVLVDSTKTVARLMSTDTKLRCLNQPRPQVIFGADYCYQRISSSCDRHPLVFTIKAEVKFFLLSAKKSMIFIFLRGVMSISPLTDMPERKERDVAAWG